MHVMQMLIAYVEHTIGWNYALSNFSLNRDAWLTIT